MPNWLADVAAASATVGTDLFSGEVWARAPQDRVVTALALKGSAAAGDTNVEFYADEVRIGDMWNTGTGVPDLDDYMPVEALMVPGGAQLRAIVRDAPATNPIYAGITVEDAE